MKKNRLKNVFLMLSMISLSILLTVIPTTYSIYSQNMGLWTSYMHKDKQILETDFYKSNVFEFNVLRPILYWMGESVSDVDSNISNYINENTYYEDVSKGLNEYGNEIIETKERKPTKEEAKNDLLNKVNYGRNQLNQIQNIKFMVKNTKTNEYYTNTEYKTFDEFDKNIDEYTNIKIDKNNSNRSYIKTINKKVSENPTHYIEGKLLDATPEENLEVHMSFPKLLSNVEISDKVYNEYHQYTQTIKEVYICLILMIVNIIVFIISAVTYKKIKINEDHDEGILTKLSNKVPIDIILWLMAIDFLLYVPFSLSYYQGYRYMIEKICAVIGAYLLIYAAYTINRRSKKYDKKIYILKETIVYKLYKILKNTVISALKASKEIPLIKRIIIVSIGITFIGGVVSVLLYELIYNEVMLLFGIPMSMILFTLYIVKKLAYLSDIIEGTSRIKNGELDYKIDLLGNDSFTNLAENINNIGEGLEKSIETQLRSERMKSELITNVSHDLKTPLTSIINYIELIKKEDVTPEHVNDYIKVLDQKSKRLKILIEDLFEASKASSGNLELNMENIDIVQLLRQSIGEMEEKLTNSNLDIRLKLSSEKINIYADGRRMYRVFENLLSNISKYSLPSTRVYIDLLESDESVIITMKNISSYELNFDATEITERFKRADESRNTEGSGLGLAISKDLVNLQGGKFSVEIDGDLFKSILVFPKIDK
ncbi:MULTISPECIES: sensor histidine kinase [unclassified Romboutsia]|uniref:sensor histidine kinase n=1 Tax=unclassified Romboutsia TaxID=2626894 RepID=UPI001FAE005F|nr:MULTISPECIES: sensor histidine kinase [unclassified Romboutsia]MDB8800845.1 sensor histidine kinase [Romboutsia sp. 1001216sp1]MDB8803875.1 sensor histidine kinase [Romboutsia sp. 1001216sp1]MDB8806775.1 sensor histidine kinase [Romboutsia sp. 1001216sp1]MDB8809522.1 sensor histidine kinase [Romboutsia sp. 1001216sp1]MDB8812244.1 sensor histidine kinase [Romboutsia sp. 1001216sp1]